MLLLVFTFLLLIVTCPVKRWLQAENSVSFSASSARSHETGIRAQSGAEQEGLACSGGMHKIDNPATAFSIKMQKEVPSHNCTLLKGFGIAYFLSSLPHQNIPSNAVSSLHSLPLFLQHRNLRI